MPTLPNFLRPSRFGVMIRCATLLAIGLTLGGARSSFAEAYALIVGIDEYQGAWPKLNSCAEDARDVYELLTNVYRLPADHLRLLLNEQATKAAVEREFKALLVERPATNDHILFYFSGHGALMPNLTDPSGPPTRKVLVPTDIPAKPVPPEAVIGHDELLRWIEASLTSKKTVVLDCCHSGTQTKGAAPIGTSQFRPKVLDLGYGPAERNLSENIRLLPSRTKSARRGTIVWMGACRTSQIAYTGDHNSLFTSELLRWVRRDPQAALTNTFPNVQTEVFRVSSTCAPTPQEPQGEGELREELVEKDISPTLTSVSLPTVIPVPQPTARATHSDPPPLPTLFNRHDFGLVLKTDKIQYLAGEEMRLQVTSARDAYLRVYLLNADLQVNLIFPNAFQRDNLLRAGQAVAIPAAGADFRFALEAPFGTETLVAVAQTAQFSDQGDKTLDQLAEMTRSLKPAETRTRGIRVESASNRISSAEVCYTVSEK